MRGWYAKRSKAMQNVADPMQHAAYPVQVSVDYPDRPLDKLTTFFRIFIAIPIVIVLGVVAGGPGGQVFRIVSSER